MSITKSGYITCFFITISDTIITEGIYTIKDT